MCCIVCMGVMLSYTSVGLGAGGRGSEMDGRWGTTPTSGSIGPGMFEGGYDVLIVNRDTFATLVTSVLITCSSHIRHPARDQSITGRAYVDSIQQDISKACLILSSTHELRSETMEFNTHRPDILARPKPHPPLYM